MFLTRDIAVESFHNCDVSATHGPNKRGKILFFFLTSWAHFKTKKKVPKVQKSQKHQKYLLNLKIIRYKCHSDTLMSSFWPCHARERNIYSLLWHVEISQQNSLASFAKRSGSEKGNLLQTLFSKCPPSLLVFILRYDVPASNKINF